MRREALIQAMAEAIATMEGFYRADTLARRHNNPGNLRTWGRRPRRDGFVVFPNADEGFRALRTQIAKNIDRGLTVLEFFAGKPGVYPGYAPAADSNHPTRYAEFVAKRLSLQSGIPIVISDRITDWIR